MKQFIVGCLAVGLTGVSQGMNIWNGSGDLSRSWTDGANWSDGTPPASGDGVMLRSFGKPLVVSDDDAALASRISFYWDINGAVGDDIVWNVSTNAEFHGTFANWSASSGRIAGRFIKRGAGDLNLVLPSGGSVSSYKDPRWVVEKGVLRLPRFAGKPPFGNASAGNMSVSNGATVVVFACTDGVNSSETTFEKLVCDGLLTNEVAGMTAQVHVNSKPDDPSEVRGAIGGNIRFAPSGSIDFYGTANTFPVFRPNGRSGVSPQVIGVMDFGTGTSPSSLGTENELSYDFNGPVYRYLGTGGTLSKTLYVRLHGEHPSWDLVHPPSVDGGPFGGLTLANTISVGQNDGMIDSMIIEGANAAPCVYRASQKTFAAADGRYRALHTIKRGSGTWEFPFSAPLTLEQKTPHMIGGLSIEEGTVRAEVITDRGQPSSIGAGTDCYGEYMGPYDATKRVDWSLSFGAANAAGVADKEGALEYYGDLKGYSSNRKMVLLGNGRIRNASTNTLQMARVSARTAGEKTLTLDGDNAGDNVLSEVSDGAGTVSVAKEGSGRWILRGNQTFSGDLTVRAGTLEVQAPTDYFRWYRLTFLALPSDFDLHYHLYKIAFFDKDGNQLALQSYLPPPWPEAGSGNNNVISREFLDLPEPSGRGAHGMRSGYVLPGRAGTYYWSDYQNCFSYVWFTTEDRGVGYLKDVDGVAYPTAGQEWSSFPIVVRLRSDIAPVAYYDLAAGWSEKRNPTAVRFEGSRDGVCWYELDRRELAYPGEKNWYSDGTAWSAASRAVGNGVGYAVTSNVEVASLQNVRSVRVLEGATLVTAAENVGEIRALTIGADGIGTIDGFTFAESGTVNFVDMPERLRRALTFCGSIRNDGGTAANLNKWKFTVNGKSDPRLTMGYGNGSFTLSPPGLLISLASAAPRPVVVVNEDNDRYFCTRGEEGMTVSALEAYVDRIAGGKITHFFMCPSGQRTSYDSQAWEPIWACLTEPGCSDSRWGLNAKLLHDRGIDIYEVWIRRCRELGISPWLSPRMNDAHNADMEWPIRNTTFWRTRKDLHNPGGTLNFASQEVQDYTFALVQEQLERYDIDGYELDFMRFDQYFPVDDATNYTHCLDRFVSRVHDAVVAAKAVRGHDILLGVRVPTTPRAALSRGMDVGLWARSGWVDWVCASTPWRTPDYNMPVAEWRAWFGAAAGRIKFLAGTDHGVTAFEWERTDMTPELYAGFADVAWGSGADGVYLFNASYLESALATVCRKGLFPADLTAYRRRYPVSFRDTSYGVVPDDVQLPRLSDRVNRFTVRLGARPVGRVSVLVGVRQDGPFNPPITLNGVAPFRSQTEKLDVVCRDHPDQLMPYFCRRFSFPPWAVHPRADNIIELQPSETKMSIGWVEITLEEIGK